MEPEEITPDALREVNASIEELSHGIADLRDLFVRRLYDDKQKSNLISELQAQASFSGIEPFLHDIILLLDRMEKVEDDFVHTVYDELLDIIRRRGAERIVVTKQFDSDLNRVVRVVEDEACMGTMVTGVVRNGYTFGGRVIRPAEVVVSRGTAKSEKEEWQNGQLL